MKNPETWFQEKTEVPSYKLKRAITVTEEYVRHTGGRIIHGNVTLSAEPSSAFAYRSEVEWPDRERPEMYETHVFHGIMDILFTFQHAPILGLTIVLKQIRWDEINSCAVGFYGASRKAIEKILRPSENEWNYELMK